jgi:predicted MFS family arabinose efflux permease
VLPEEADYTKALSLSRLAYDLESLVSPMLAALLLSVMSYHSLFGGTVAGFIASAALVVSAVLPKAKMPPKRSIYERTTRGMRIYLATPRLRGLLALNLAVAAGSAMVIVNTVVLVQSQMGLTQTSTAIALACFGAGSMLMALTLPRLLDKVRERPAMLVGASVVAAALILGWVTATRLDLLLPLWFVMGVGYSLAQTPSGRLLRRSSTDADRPALFAAHFALSHACWLITYPLAGWVGARYGIDVSFVSLGVVAVAAIALSALMWPEHEPAEVAHTHENLPPDHPHLVEVPQGAMQKHSHAFVIDDEHQRWPH